jgi:hypothetical protein
VEPEETSIARQRLGKHVPAATNTQTTIEGVLGNGFFSVWTALMLYNEDSRPDEGIVEKRWRYSRVAELTVEEIDKRSSRAAMTEDLRAET